MRERTGCLWQMDEKGASQELLFHLSSLHMTPHHPIALPLRLTSLHFTALRFTSLHFISLPCASLHLISVYFISPHLPSLRFTHFTSLHIASLQFTPLRCTSLRFTSRHFILLHPTTHHFTSHPITAKNTEDAVVQAGRKCKSENVNLLKSRTGSRFSP